MHLLFYIKFTLFKQYNIQPIYGINIEDTHVIILLMYNSQYTLINVLSEIFEKQIKGYMRVLQIQCH